MDRLSLCNDACRHVVVVCAHYWWRLLLSNVCLSVYTGNLGIPSILSHGVFCLLPSGKILHSLWARTSIVSESFIQNSVRNFSSLSVMPSHLVLLPYTFELWALTPLLISLFPPQQQAPGFHRSHSVIRIHTNWTRRPHFLLYATLDSLLLLLRCSSL